MFVLSPWKAYVPSRRVINDRIWSVLVFFRCTTAPSTSRSSASLTVPSTERTVRS